MISMCHLDFASQSSKFSGGLPGPAALPDRRPGRDHGRVAAGQPRPQVMPDSVLMMTDSDAQVQPRGGDQPPGAGPVAAEREARPRGPRHRH